MSPNRLSPLPPGLWQRPRRPSTPAVPDAGLLAADPLHPATAGGTDSRAAVRPGLLRPRAEPPLCDRDLSAPAVRGGSLRPRVVLFVLFVLVLLLVPLLAVRL